MRIWMVLAVTLIIVNSSFALTTEEQKKVVERARLEVTRGVVYNASYVKIKFPGGDVPQSQGACVEVVIRALRAIGYDLQEKMAKGKRVDRNLYHRRCANQIPYFRKHAMSLTKNPNAKDWQPGDIIYWDLNGKGLLHTGIVSDKKNVFGRLYVIQNIGPVASEDDALDLKDIGLSDSRIVAHFRL